MGKENSIYVPGFLAHQGGFCTSLVQKGNKDGESQSPSCQFICSRHHFLGFLLKHLKQERQRGWAKLLVLPCTDRQSEKG